MKIVKDNIFEIIFILIIALLFHENVSDWIKKWSDFDSFYAFGFFMLAFVVYLIRKNYKILSEIKNNPSWWGIPLLLIGLFLYVIGVRADYDYIANTSFPFFVAGLLLVIKGKEFFIAILFPLILLSFAIPVLPLHRITMPFQLLSAEITTFILSFLGLQAVNDGNIILLEGHRISVVAGCSGLKSLYSIFFICVIYSYFINTSFIKKIGFVIASIPLALSMNVFRILTVSFYVLYNGEEHAEAFHDGAGVVAYVISIALIILVSMLIEDNKENNKREVSIDEN